MNWESLFYFLACLALIWWLLWEIIGFLKGLRKGNTN